MTYECLLYDVKDRDRDADAQPARAAERARRHAAGRPLRRASRRPAADPEVRVLIVITGAGRGFCSGGDVKSMSERETSGETALADRAGFADARPHRSSRMRDCPKPIIAAVNGAAAGAGMNLALACDMRIASTAAKFSQAFVKRGLTPDWGGTWFLPRIVGTAKACELIFTGDSIDAAEALRLGIVNAVVAPEDADGGNPQARREDRRRSAGRDPARQARDLSQPGRRSARRPRVRNVRAGHLPADRGLERGRQGVHREARAGVQGR